MFLKLAMPIVVLCAVSSPVAVAQHGEAEAGYYGLDYHGDTWTRTLTAVDHEKDAITLTYERKGKRETFTGVFKHPLQVVDEYGRPAKAHLRVGDSLTAYYVNGKKHDGIVDDNLIFKIKLLPPPKHK
jgi:hypothetical protein